MRQYQINALSGTVIGKLEDGIACFRGIRYAETPRWERAVPYQYKQEMIPADGASIDPVQPNYDGTACEDALFLNIYLNPDYEGRRAVLAYTPVGGGIFSRGASIEPHLFLREHPSVMVVVCNCRVGLLSSLNLQEFPDFEEKYKYSCNLTKTDFLEALKWIRKNIADFGGDPENVTTSGHSYGATVTCSLFLMPEAEGYFQKALPRSCYAIDSSMLMSLEESRQYAKVFRRISGSDTLEQAKTIPVEKLLEIQSEMLRQMPAGIPQEDFPGTLCPPFCTVNDHVVIFDDYFETLCRTAGHVRLMTGTTSGDNDARFNFFGDPDQLIQDMRTRYYNIMDPHRGGIHGDELIQSYTDHHSGDLIMALADLNGDLGMRRNALATASVFARKGTVYMYYYDFYLDNPSLKRAAHGSAENAAWGRPAETPDYMARAIRAAYASFIQYGDPNLNNDIYKGSKEQRGVYTTPVSWLPWTMENQYTMVYDNSGFRLQDEVRRNDSDAILKEVREYPLIQKLYDM